MTWHYRLVKYADGSGFGVHEVYYNDDGTPKAMSKKPTDFVGETVEEVNRLLMLANADVKRCGVFEEPPEWAK